MTLDFYVGKRALKLKYRRGLSVLRAVALQGF
jgi:hypothetical protein